jgi:hypothetical protein
MNEEISKDRKQDDFGTPIKVNKIGNTEEFVSDVLQSFGNISRKKQKLDTQEIMKQDSTLSLNSTKNQIYSSATASDHLKSELSHVEEKNSIVTDHGIPTFETTVPENANSKKLEKDLKLFGELRKQYKEANPGPSEDDWLDDEQWYCENLATWTNIDIPDEVFYNPSKLISFLEAYINESEKSSSNSSSLAEK